MPHLKSYDLFISHAWKYSSEYSSLISLLDNIPLFYYRDYSSPNDKPMFHPDERVYHSRLEEAIENNIRPVNIVLVIAGMYYNYKKWIQFEVDTALRFKKPIIAIMPWGAQRQPTELMSSATAIVNWNTNSIVEAIRSHAI